MNFKPLYDRLVIDPQVEENISSAGIVLPQTAQERPQIGIVVAVGSGEDIEGNKIGMQVKIGDKVLFGKFSGTEIQIDEKKYIVIRQPDILAVLEEA